MVGWVDDAARAVEDGVCGGNHRSCGVIVQIGIDVAVPWRAI